MNGQPKNILIIKPSALGDIVLAMPAAAALKRSFPQARISWLVRSEYADLLRGHPDLDEVILFDRRLLGRGWHSPKAFAELVRFLRRLRKGRFDLVFDFQGLFRTGFFAWMTGCGKRFGMATVREFAYIFYTHKVAQDYGCIHLVDYYLRMVAAGGAQEGAVEFRMPEDAGAADTIDKLLKSQGVKGEYVVIVPGAAQPNKRWPAEHFAELAGKIGERFGLSIVAIGSQGEREYIEAIQTGGKARVINLAGKTTVCELISLMKKASLVVSNDTGPGHIAAAAGVPIVMIFGPTNPARVCPYGRPECVVAVEPTERGMKADSYEPRHDIAYITVEQVFERVRLQIEKAQGG